MDLPSLSSPPPAAEPVLEKTLVSQMFPATAGELTVSIETRFTPDRVGSTTGTSSIALYGQLEAERRHPGSDYQTMELGAHVGLRRVRLARYRWLVSDISLEPPSAQVRVDRAAAAPTLVAPALATGDSTTFWLSSLGVDDLALEDRANPVLPVFQDYVQVTLWAYSQDAPGRWAASLRARRVLAGYVDTAWERKLALGETDACEVSLGDHRLELLEVRWVDAAAPADVHARFRLTRGATADGMTPAPPPKPFVPRP